MTIRSNEPVQIYLNAIAMDSVYSHTTHQEVDNRNYGIPLEKGGPVMRTCVQNTLIFVDFLSAYVSCDVNIT